MENEHEYVFGFGSIINSSTHAAWLENDNDTTTGTTSKEPLKGQVVRIRASFGYERRWNFRSTTGFTALGVSRTTTGITGTSTNAGMNGVLFQVPLSMMPGFDRREVGYDKVQIPMEHIDLNPKHDEDALPQLSLFQLTSNDKIWIYVPQARQCLEADENHPLLQSYVDTVLQGCLEWGGSAMAEEFVLTTGGWSSFFLNDTPSSRRPWLFRKDYDTIDRILQCHSDLTHFADRRHPEEFASTFLIRRMRGTWSIPRRNRHFTGRDTVLTQIHARLMQHTGDHHSSVHYLFVQGMGGVGKSSVCIEYCYRHFPTSYGLVIWLNAESAETLSADYRQLLADLADVDKDNNSNEEVIGEVKTRLFRCKVSWLLVFDNLEDRTLLERFVPRGATAGSKGHVLVTSRVGEWDSGSSPSSFVLGCLSPTESVQLLGRSIGGSSCTTGSNKKERAATTEICERLGHLPLALGMAAAYMQRCDVTCSEYLERYVRSEQTGKSLLLRNQRLQDYSLTVSASLALSLNAIQQESQTAFSLLRLLGWLGPDHITKALLRALLATKNKADQERARQEAINSSQQSSLLNTQQGAAGILFLAAGLGVSCLMPWRRKGTPPIMTGSGLLVSMSLCASGLLVLAPLLRRKQTDAPPPAATVRRRSSGTLGIDSDEFEQSDIVWKVLKSFSILTVREGKGSMHRLLSQALRVDQSQTERCYNHQICVDAMQMLWQFDPRNATTWQDSFHLVEHVKALVIHCSNNNNESQDMICTNILLQAGLLSKQAGVFSAMAMNGFKEAEASFRLAIQMYDRLQGKQQSSKGDTVIMKAKAESFCELGKALRYQGNFGAAEETLLHALEIWNKLAEKDRSSVRSVADTLHELGVLEVKKHKLDTAQQYLTKSLDLRRTLDEDSSDVDADCAATLHQLATVHVARKPPLLKKAEELLQEALKHSRQIGQRAATLKQLARVTIRQGLLDTAEGYLRRALELYIELYGERTMHINVAAVKFQQGALAFQREQFEQAWIHFSECLRIRRHVYAYAREVSSDGAEETNPLHLEVSCVLHELGCVAFAQTRFPQAMSMLQAERSILQNLEDSTTQTERLRQALLTNLTWLRKCALGMNDEKNAALFAAERADLKGKTKAKGKVPTLSEQRVSLSLQREALRCREAARQFALSKGGDTALEREAVLEKLATLKQEIEHCPTSSLHDAAQDFHDTLRACLDPGVEVTRSSSDTILGACDRLRDTLRAHGAQVNDIITSSS
ncbi:NB-ARC domain [Seminavis robusta]|uniref:NB-ARC domain n=1 Tax=Seminavis robusta TaxID=568900 RepID=A0A9N8DHB1_9STRA|nr:NB-ARC domain [Seminavis robusta]|eukprot:Sro121_g058790.1 NB-ARC domain (1249) ;mRNA; r:30221-34151